MHPIDPGMGVGLFVCMNRSQVWYKLVDEGGFGLVWWVAR